MLKTFRQLIGKSVTLQQSICFTTSSILCNIKFYDALGITKASTKGEIKAAYYKLSMLYHPDKNKGCELAAKKFREITEAYEILSNYKLRKLYDKGIIHRGESLYDRCGFENIDIKVEDDPSTQFYKSRLKQKNFLYNKDSGPNIYDFDEWSRAHYGTTFQRRKDAKARYERKKSFLEDKTIDRKENLFLFTFLFIFMYSLIYSQMSYDTPQKRTVDVSNNDKNN